MGIDPNIGDVLGGQPAGQPGMPSHTPEQMIYQPLSQVMPPNWNPRRRSNWNLPPRRQTPKRIPTNLFRGAIQRRCPTCGQPLPLRQRPQRPGRERFFMGPSTVPGRRFGYGGNFSEDNHKLLNLGPEVAIQ